MNTATHRHTAQPDLPHADDELLTIKEVAALLRVPEATLRYWRHLGKGPNSFRVGRSVRYWRTDILLWLEEQSDIPQPPPVERTPGVRMEGA